MKRNGEMLSVMLKTSAPWCVFFSIMSSCTMYGAVWSGAKGNQKSCRWQKHRMSRLTESQPSESWTRSWTNIPPSWCSTTRLISSVWLGYVDNFTTLLAYRWFLLTLPLDINLPNQLDEESTILDDFIRRVLSLIENQKYPKYCRDERFWFPCI